MREMENKLNGSYERQLNSYQTGDTIENYFTINFEDIDGDDIKEIVEEENIQIFEGINSDTLTATKLYRRNILGLSKEGLNSLQKGNVSRSLKYYFDE